MIYNYVSAFQEMATCAKPEFTRKKVDVQLDSDEQLNEEWLKYLTNPKKRKTNCSSDDEDAVSKS